MSKRALLVGINKFGPGIRELRGCINDTVEMRGLLKDYFGFQEADIRVMHDDDASAQDIRDGLGWPSPCSATRGPPRPICSPDPEGRHERLLHQLQPGRPRLGGVDRLGGGVH